MTDINAVEYIRYVTEIQRHIRDLKAKGWTHQAIADELGVTWSGLRNWETGFRSPVTAKPVELALSVLADRKPPPKRRYPTGHYMQRRKAERERESGDQTNKGQGNPGDRNRRARVQGYEGVEGGHGLADRRL